MANFFLIRWWADFSRNIIIIIINNSNDNGSVNTTYPTRPLFNLVAMRLVLRGRGAY